ncbi:MAG TPA: HAD family phosphatase [Azospirillum sp.]
MPPSAVAFGIGNVLVEWDPRHVYRPLFDGDEALMEDFLTHVCSPEWQRELERGRPWAEAVGALTAAFPECAELIRTFHACWADMAPGEVPGMPEIVGALKALGVRLYGVANAPVEGVAVLARRFNVLGLLDGVVVSGEEGMAVPIHRRLLDRYGLVAADTLFIDAAPAGIADAAALGMATHHFTSAAKLREELERLGLPS